MTDWVAIAVRAGLIRPRYPPLRPRPQVIKVSSEIVDDYTVAVCGTSRGLPTYGQAKIFLQSVLVGGNVFRMGYDDELNVLVVNTTPRHPITTVRPVLPTKAYTINLGNGYGEVMQEINYRQLWERYTQRDYERLLRGTWENYPRWTRRLIIAPSYRIARFELDLLTSEIGIWERERQTRDRRRLADGYEYRVISAGSRFSEQKVRGYGPDTEYVPIFIDEWTDEMQMAVKHRLKEAPTVSRLEIQSAKIRILRGEHLSWAIHSRK